MLDHCKDWMLDQFLFSIKVILRRYLLIISPISSPLWVFSWVQRSWIPGRAFQHGSNPFSPFSFGLQAKGMQANISISSSKLSNLPARAEASMERLPWRKPGAISLLTRISPSHTQAAVWLPLWPQLHFLLHTAVARQSQPLHATLKCLKIFP